MTEDTVKKKPNDLITKPFKLTALFFSYHIPMTEYLEDK